MGVKFAGYPHLPQAANRPYARLCRRTGQKDKANYTRARWQVDAHAFWRSSGNRMITAEEMSGYGPDKLATIFTKFSLENIYDYEQHVMLGEDLELHGAFAVTFASLAPGSHHPMSGMT